MDPDTVTARMSAFTPVAPATRAEVPEPRLPPREGPSPFDQADADFIIRTRDDVEFHVYRIILSLSSPFFEDMFSLPQPGVDSITYISGNAAGIIPAVDVSEDSRTMETFLRILYPVSDPELKTLEDVRRLLEAGRKYDVEVVITAARKSLAPSTSPSSFLREDPLRVFAIACLFDLEEEAKTAAGEIATFGCITFRSLDCPELEEITAGVYFRLLRFIRAWRHRLTHPHPPYNPGDPYQGIAFAGILPFCRSGSERASPPQPVAPNSVTETITPSARLDFPKDCPSADIILRSSDGLQIRAHSFVINMASPTLLHRLVKTQDGQHDSSRVSQDPPLPAFQVDEPGVVLRDLIRLCYPTHLFESWTFPDLAHFLRVFYTATRQGLHGVARALWDGHARSYAKTEPLRFYFIAAGQGWKKEATWCARELIRSVKDVGAIETMYTPEMEDVRNGTYLRLLEYVERCQTVAQSALGGVTGLPEAPCKHDHCLAQFPTTIKAATAQNPSPSCHWLLPHLSTMGMALRRKPCGSSVKGSSFVAKIFLMNIATHHHKCVNTAPQTTCGLSSRMEWGLALLDRYAAAVDDAVDNVVLELPF